MNLKKVGQWLMIVGISFSYSIWTINEYGLKSGIFSLGIVAIILGFFIILILMSMLVLIFR